MQHTMSFRRGDVVLVPFPFTEQKASKKRPALVVSGDQYSGACPDVILAQITGRLDVPPRPGDYRLKDWRGAGLVAPSLVRARLTTLHSSVVLRRLGRMPNGDMIGVNRSLMTALDLAAGT